MPAVRQTAATDAPTRPEDDLPSEPEFFLPIEFLEVLTIAQRCDRHFSNEFYRAVEALRILSNSSRDKMAAIMEEELNEASQISEGGPE